MLILFSLIPIPIQFIDKKPAVLIPCKTISPDTLYTHLIDYGTKTGNKAKGSQRMN